MVDVVQVMQIEIYCFSHNIIQHFYNLLTEVARRLETYREDWWLRLGGCSALSSLRRTPLTWPPFSLSLVSTRLLNLSTI